MDQFRDLVMVGRSHNVPAQLTTLGKRLATIAEELLFALERLEALVERLPLRGLRGPMGTSQDLRDLVGRDFDGVEREVVTSLGFTRTLASTGQIYPRSIDFEVLSSLVQVAAAPSNFALLIRLMSGAGLLHEGFQVGQVGSSAMPHKINARSSERINGLVVVLKGYQFMASELSGSQWNEGDVSCSVVRRVCLPDAFFAVDGIFQTFASILSSMKVMEDVIQKEVETNLPLISSSSLLIEAVKKGMGREEAHQVIQRHSLAFLKEWPQGDKDRFCLALAEDPEFPLTLKEIENVLSLTQGGLSAAGDQVTQVQRNTRKILESSQSTFGTWDEIL
jgi:adenylosuccinate lyase